MPRIPQRAVFLGVASLAALAAYVLLRPAPLAEQDQKTDDPGTAIVAVTMPDLSSNALTGQTLFENTCAACHGPAGAGHVALGPPLIHKIYEPSHHGDESFQRAVANGVRAHHWPFGDMAPVKGMTRDDVTMIIDYIRQIQRANGIH